MRPQTWIALALSLCCPGLGQLYVGRLLRGLVLFLISLAIVPTAALAAGLISSTVTLLGLIAAFLGLLGLWIFAVVDACRLAAKSVETERREYQTPLVYGLFAIVGITSPMLSTLFVRQNLLEAFIVPAASMAPTLRPGDRILANKARWRIERLERSDVIVFRAPDQRKQNFVKRIVGLPGDQVVVDGREVTVNGKPIELIPQSGAADAVAEPPIPERLEQTVPPGTYFVLGDNRGQSHDSRQFGPVPFGDVVGVAEYIYCPGDTWSRFGALP